LDECLSAVFAVANEHKVTSIAIPAIGTGVFKFPLELCASITAKAIKANAGGSVQIVRICVTDENIKAVFLSALAAENVLVEV
jgi:O-acetyl-ADP-ribose deacetylase